jgi:hypothetical protein
MSIFDSDKDRSIVKLTIQFNLTAIHTWLDANPQKEGGNDEKTDGSYWRTIEKTKDEWEYGTVRSYHIDVLPNGRTHDFYFHRAKKSFSNYVDGFEANDGKKWTSQRIEMLEWEYWRKSIALKVNGGHPIFLAPLTEFGELQVFGELKNADYSAQPSKIKVPVRFESQSDKPIEFLEVGRICNHPHSITYKGTLASVTAFTSGLLGMKVEY